MSEKPLALIDIGSNSGRMIVVRLTAGVHLDVLVDARVRLQLMRDLGADGHLSETAAVRTVDSLIDFLSIAGNVGATRVIAVATAAVREAGNRAEFVSRLRAETGISVKVLDGDEEARLACLGAVHGLPVENGCLVDIGGGSVEIARFRKRKQVATWTLPLGALRLTDRFFRDDPPRPVELEALDDYVRTMLLGAGVPVLPPGEQAVGTGGTIRSVAKIHRATVSYPIPRLHGYVLKRADVAEVARRVNSRSLARRRSIAGLSGDRADSITGGSLTLAAVLDYLGAKDLLVSGQGLREGLAFQHVSGSLPPAIEVRRAGVTALASRFRDWAGDSAEARRALIDPLLEVLDDDLPDEMRETLEHAATLLDIGRSVDFYNRWQHSASIVLGSDLSGFSHRGIALVAAVIEAACRDGSRARGRGGLLTSEDRKLIDRASVVLLLADAFGRRIQPDAAVHIERRDRRGVVVLRVPTAPAWQPGDVAKRFRRAFGRSLQIESGPSSQARSGVTVELK